MVEVETQATLAAMPEVLTLPEVAQVLRIGRNTAYDLARRNALPVPVIRCGRRLIVSKAALKRVLEAIDETAQV